MLCSDKMNFQTVILKLMSETTLFVCNERQKKSGKMGVLFGSESVDNSFIGRLVLTSLFVSRSWSRWFLRWRLLSFRATMCVSA